MEPILEGSRGSNIFFSKRKHSKILEGGKRVKPIYIRETREQRISAIERECGAAEEGGGLDPPGKF